MNSKCDSVYSRSSQTNMSSKVRAVAITLLCTILACCRGENITGYVMRTLTSATCETVITEVSVCNVVWKISGKAAAQYDKNIKAIKELVSSGDIVAGLTFSEVTECREAYASMLCGNYFPVCNSAKFTVDYGNGTARCLRVNKACRTIFIEGCASAENGEKSMVTEAEKSCVPLQADTSNFCPDFNMKIPQDTTNYMTGFVRRLSDTARTFDGKTKNVTGMESCASNYKEALCRMITPCSPNGFYVLYLMGMKECDEKLACTKNYDPKLNVVTSMCVLLPNIEKYKKISVPNPFHGATITLKEPKTTKKTNTEASFSAKETTLSTYSTEKSSEETDSFTEIYTEIRTEITEINRYPTNTTLTNKNVPKEARSEKGSAGKIKVKYVWFMVVTLTTFFSHHILL